MFILMTLRDTVFLSPPSFSLPFNSSVLLALHAKYCNRVLPQHGLFISPHRLLSTSAPVIPASSPSPHITATFTMLTFQPFVGEILTGRIKQCDRSGLLVSLDFFDWVVVTEAEMQQPAEWDEQEQLWLWRYDGHELYMDLQQEVRVKVTGVLYGKREPPQLEEDSAAGSAATTSVAAAAAEQKDGKAEAGSVTASALSSSPAPPPLKRKETIASYQPAMKVTASIKEDGLGLLAWWD